MAQSSSVRIGWIVMLILGILLGTMGLMVVFATEAMFLLPDFEAFTAKNWSDFLADYPKAGELFIIVARLLGAVLLMAALFIILVAWKSYRKAQKWSWYTLLITGILGWGGGLASDIAIGRAEAIVFPIIGIVLLVIGLAVPAKAILSNKST